MAYMNQEKKKQIAAELKKVVPADWKYTLGVRNNSTLVMTIRSAPYELLKNSNERGYCQVNEYYLETSFEGEILETMKKIKNALNILNYDRSDIQSDYFDRGYYIDINIGEWNKPFINTAEVKEEEVA